MFDWLRRKKEFQETNTLVTCPPKKDNKQSLNNKDCLSDEARKKMEKEFKRLGYM